MTDIRNIREEEGETFLQLLCNVFGLDYNRAYDIFFTEPMFDLHRKWALFDGPEMLAILTTTPLQFGWGRAVGIAGVATRADRQGEGLAGQLLRKVLSESEKRGEGPALLFAKDVRVYEKNGFEALDRVLRADVAVSQSDSMKPMDGDEVRHLYRVWADQDENRLRRDDRRWDYWNWHYRVCTPFKDGYICGEQGTLREVLYTGAEKSLPVPEGTEWFGTARMTDLFEVPISNGKVELYLMGRGIPGVPEMFMTDQF